MAAKPRDLPAEPSADPERRQGTVAMSRRELMALGAAAALAARCGGSSVPEAPAASALTAAGPVGAAKTFLSSAELAMVDELSELIIPTDAHSAGAKAAGVAAYIDGSLAEAFEENVRATWRDGLRRIDELARQAHGKPFMSASADERVAVLTEIARNEAKPQKPEEEFFVELKSRVAWAYYTTEIGIKQELEYKGNTFQATFAGYD
jgi:hypothetical protein